LQIAYSAQAPLLDLFATKDTFFPIYFTPSILGKFVFYIKNYILLFVLETFYPQATTIPDPSCPAIKGIFLFVLYRPYKIKMSEG